MGPPDFKPLVTLTRPSLKQALASGALLPTEKYNESVKNGWLVAAGESQGIVVSADEESWKAPPAAKSRTTWASPGC